MNSAMWTYFFMVIGVFGIVIINLFSHILLSNEQNYMLTKEITEAAMVDAIDWKGYSQGLGWDKVTSDSWSDPDSMHCGQEPGQYRILKEKFVESFIRRFAEAAGVTKEYTITFHDIDECPPKVSLTISSRENFSFFRIFNVDYQGNANGEDVKNSISGILESVEE